MKQHWIMVAVLAGLAFADDAIAQRGRGGQGQQQQNCPQQGQPTGPVCRAACQQPQAPQKAASPRRQRLHAAPSVPPPAATPQGLQRRIGRQQGPAAGQGACGACAQPAAAAGRGGKGRPADANLRPRRRAAAVPAAPTAALAPALVTQLQGVLADEYLARDFYLAAAERFGGRQFANLARAEQHHVDALTRLLRAAGATPVVGPTTTVERPADLAGALASAEAIEREVIAAYEVLLAADTDPAVHRVFENIQAANRRHLAATDR